MPSAEDATGGRQGVRCRIAVGCEPYFAFPFVAVDMVAVVKTRYVMRSDVNKGVGMSSLWGSMSTAYPSIRGAAMGRHAACAESRQSEARTRNRSSARVRLPAVEE